MASAAPAERFHIVLAPEERRKWTTNAAAAGLPTSAYVRRAVEAYEEGIVLSPTEVELLDHLLKQLNDTAVSIHRDVQETSAQLATFPEWESEMKLRVAERLAREPVELNPAVLDFSRV